MLSKLLGTQDEPEELFVKCICSFNVLHDELIGHTKGCREFNNKFGKLGEEIEHDIQIAKENSEIELLWHIFAIAQKICKGKLNKYPNPKIDASASCKNTLTGYKNPTFSIDYAQPSYAKEPFALLEQNPQIQRREMPIEIPSTIKIKSEEESGESSIRLRDSELSNLLAKYNLSDLPLSSPSYVHKELNEFDYLDSVKHKAEQSSASSASPEFNSDTLSLLKKYGISENAEPSISEEFKISKYDFEVSSATLSNLDSNFYEKRLSPIKDESNFDFSHKYEEYQNFTIVSQPPSYQEDTAGLQCGMCFKKFYDKKDIVYLDKCLHTVCLDDIKSHIEKELSEKDAVHCPVKGCGLPLSISEIERIIGPAVMKRCNEKFVQSSLKSMNLVQCPKCKNMWEHEEGRIDPRVRDENGNMLSWKASQHFAKFRARCPQSGCNTTFCSSCHTNPYHLGFTCEEFKEYEAVQKCRYCQSKIEGSSASSLPAFQNVCRKKECKELMKFACVEMHPCGHPCYGFRNEKMCLPCLHEKCVKNNPYPTKGQKADDYCPICYSSGIGDAPSIMLVCGHIVHLQCLIDRLKRRWSGPRINFSFCECPVCRQWVSAPHHDGIYQEIRKLHALHDEMSVKALQRLRIEGLDKDPRLRDPKDKYYKKPEEYAMDKLAYYMCNKCKKPYFGGLKECDEAQGNQEDFEEEDMICGSCSANCVKGVTACKIHGTEFIEFKCRFCCSVAQWYCWGNTHFCNSCHSRQCAGEYLNKIPREMLPVCPGEDKCPLGVRHPPNGEEFSLGCSACREVKH